MTDNIASETYTQSMGAVGYLFSGGVLYDHRSSDDGSLAYYFEGDSLDKCSGHSTNFGEYHYHLVS